MMKGSVTMGRFINGVLIGVGIGMLVAPMKGEEMRRLVSERYEVLRRTLPDNEQLKQTGQQVVTRASQTASTLKDAAQQTATKLASTTKQATTPLNQGGQTSTKTPATGEAEIVFPIDTVAPYETGAGNLTPDY
jgi:gas vesicle protein